MLAKNENQWARGVVLGLTIDQRRGNGLVSGLPITSREAALGIGGV